MEHKKIRHSALFRRLPERTAVTELQRRTTGLAPKKTAHIRCVLEIQPVGDSGDGQPRIDKVTFHFDKQLLLDQCLRRHAVNAAAHLIQIIRGYIQRFRIERDRPFPERMFRQQRPQPRDNIPRPILMRVDFRFDSLA